MHMRREDKQTLKGNQQGMAAMVIVMVLMFVISIIVLGFAQVVRREQRNALDNQLATQAYYAAESGLNLAQQKVKAKLAMGLVDKSDCVIDPNSFYGITPADLDIGENAAITCMIIRSNLNTLEYQKVGMTAVPLLVKADSGTISNIYVSWESSTDSDTFDATGCNGDAANNFEPGPSWNCPQPLLRLDVVPDPAGADPTTVAGSQFTTFLSPDNIGSPIPYTAGSVGNIKAVNCTVLPKNPRKCTAQITFSAPQAAYALRIMSIYGESNVTVHATNGSGTAVTLTDGQVLIDITAKASDVLKRLQARMPISGGATAPDFALTAGGGVCKRYQISGGVPSIDGNYPECNL